MSFSVRSERRDLEYAGGGLATLYAQRRNLLSPRFHRMVLDVLRFYREARALLSEGPEAELVAWLRERGYSEAFVEDHLLPMVGAVWSSSRDGARAFPARFLARFFENHGFLEVGDRPAWLTVRGGSRAYVRAILDGFRGEVRTRCPVRSIRREDGAVVVRAGGGAPERFDHVVVACHADQARRLLDDPSPVEDRLLSAFPYRANDVVLHDDETVMPRLRRTWSSWNYHLDDEGRGGASVTYWMNRLQRLGGARQHFVTLNRADAVRPDRVVRRLAYDHPVFTVEGVAAQARHGELVDHRRTSYCGAYWRNGFHEDGVVSALRVCRRFEVGL
jgi:predicted NAD/FAD-binding protein